ncbi:hypothetical protein OBBRIDRAFT_738475 [Obba rivulosa]|uniref:Uncharacterized protein n=1 Tax=Obba rivulosa TaxID=1052685 RepID=A0A8E2DHT9_9APHY|nr:hypothetical protein OBBRIDRAFT_738475 [Obba rivulosa]
MSISSETIVEVLEASGSDLAEPEHSQQLVRPLSSLQERKLVDYLEDQLLDVTRNFKKRSQPESTTLPTLSSYLTATHPLLSLILQIPPIDPSAALRTTLLLRLTGDVMSAIPGYVPDVQTLPQLLSWLDDLDNGWLAVLRGQAWDPETHTGVDPNTTPATPMSQTERTRLRSMLITGTGMMEEWLEGLNMNGQSYELTLETLGLQQDFDELFSKTLTEMGTLHGNDNDPRGMQGTC